jgi:hypothetical protein
MRISPETAFLTNLTRQQESARADRRGQDQDAFQAAVNGRDPAAGNLAAKQVNATARTDKTSPRQREAAELEKKDFQPLFAREAPNGARPKYVPKGQVLNMLV